MEGIWQDLWRATLTGGRGGVTMMAQSAIDIALWDVLGKPAARDLRRGEPLLINMVEGLIA